MIFCVGILLIISSAATLVCGKALQQQELESASLELVADLQWLQQLSINDGSGTISYILQFNQNQPCGYYIKANTQVIKQNVFPENISLYLSYPAIAFSISGAPLKGAQTISLQSNKLNLWKYVIVAPVTGRIRISNTLSQTEED